MAAITADSRQYNVFTFLEDDANLSDGGGDDDDENDGSRDPSRRNRNDSVTCSNDDNQPDSTRPRQTTVTSSPAAADSNGNETPAAVQMRTSFKAVDDENTPDLDLPAITPQPPTEFESSLPNAKRKIVPSSPFDLDVSLSPASSLPDLYEFDGRHTPDDLDDDTLLHNDDDDDDLENAVASSGFGPALDWEDTGDMSPIEPIPEYTAREEFDDNKKWRVVQIGDKTYRIDMQSIDQYKKVLSHGGYYGNGLNAIVVFTACHLPEKTCPNYHYIMDNLFLPASRRRIPGLRWFKRCYDMIDHRLRKKLQGLLVVHPTLFLKTIMVMMKPFVSAKFSAKMRYVTSLADLTRLIPTEYMFIPDEVLHNDQVMNPTIPTPCRKFVNY